MKPSLAAGRRRGCGGGVGQAVRHACRGVSGMGMAWSARQGRLGLYCVNGRTSELVAGPVPAATPAALAARLPLG